MLFTYASEKQRTAIQQHHSTHALVPSKVHSLFMQLQDTESLIYVTFVYTSQEPAASINLIGCGCGCRWWWCGGVCYVCLQSERLPRRRLFWGAFREVQKYLMPVGTSAPSYFWCLIFNCCGGPAWPVWKGKKNMKRTEAVMFGGPRGLSSVPRNVSNLSAGAGTAAVRVALRARLLPGA